MSEPESRGLASRGRSLERSREEALAAARPLPPHDEMLIEDLTDEEERIFVEAILGA
jgi:hypothetical protein